jgi:hypothetical protein
MTEMMVTAALRPCPECRKPMTMINGAVQGKVTLWMDGRTACATAHSEDCTLRGKAVPRIEWGVGPYKEDPA